MNLNKQVFIQNSFWLIIRENINLVIRVLGVFVLTRLITPGQYGTYAITTAIYMFFSAFFELGINVYLTKYNKDQFIKTCAAATTLLCFSSLIGAVSAIAFIPVFKIITHVDIVSIALPIFLLLSIMPLRLVPLGIMEKDFRYKELSKIEISAQIIYYIVSIPLAFKGAGVWAPTIGFIIMNVHLFIYTCQKSMYKFQLSNDIKKIKEILFFGLNYALSSIGLQLRYLILPFIVAPLLNVQAVGYIALATRIADSLNILKDATRRISVGMLSNVQLDIDKFRYAITNGMSYQLILIAPLLILFIIFSKLFIGIVLGKLWLPVIVLLPFVAFNTFYNALNTIPIVALHVKNRTYIVTVSYFLQNILMAASAWFFIKHFGIVGYGYALLVPIFASIVIFKSINKVVVGLKYQWALIWFFSFSVPLFFREFGLFCFFSLIVPFLFNTPRKQLYKLIQYLIQFFNKKLLRSA